MYEYERRALPLYKHTALPLIDVEEIGFDEEVNLEEANFDEEIAPQTAKD